MNWSISPNLSNLFTSSCFLVFLLFFKFLVSTMISFLPLLILVLHGFFFLVSFARHQFYLLCKKLFILLIFTIIFLFFKLISHIIWNLLWFFFAQDNEWCVLSTLLLKCYMCPRRNLNNNLKFFLN